MVFDNTRRLRTAVVLVIHAIAVDVAVWATSVLSRSCSIRTAVFVVDNAVAITVTEWTTLIVYRTCNLWTVVFVVGQAIVVCIRTSELVFGTWLLRTFILAVFEAVTIGIRAALEG